MKGQYEDAVKEFKKALQRAPDAVDLNITLAITYILLGQEEEAHASAAKALELYPDFSVGSVIWPYKCQDKQKLIYDAALKAGFPE